MNRIIRFQNKVTKESFIIKFGQEGVNIWDAFEFNDKNIGRTFSSLNPANQIKFLNLINTF